MTGTVDMQAKTDGLSEEGDTRNELTTKVTYWIYNICYVI